MELTNETVSNFFDKYFETVYERMGAIEKVLISSRLFPEDLEFSFKTHNVFGSSLFREEIRKIEDFAGYQSQEDIEPHLEAFESSSKQAISKLVLDWFKSKY